MGDLGGEAPLSKSEQKRRLKQTEKEMKAAKKKAAKSNVQVAKSKAVVDEGTAHGAIPFSTTPLFLLVLKGVKKEVVEEGGGSWSNFLTSFFLPGFD